MILSQAEFRRALTYAGKKGSPARPVKLSDQEISLLKELTRQMPGRSFRHLNYQAVMERSASTTPEQVAEKYLIRTLVDQIMNRTGLKRNGSAGGGRRR